MLKNANNCPTAQADGQPTNGTSSVPRSEPTKEALILQCLQTVTKCAWRYRERLRHTEVGDLVGEAMLAIVEHAREAPYKKNPVAWLVSVGKYRMIEYVATQDTLIPHHENYSHYPMTSLDGLCTTGEDDLALLDALTYHLVLPDASMQKDHTNLYEAINHLSPTRQRLIAQRYGLSGNPETPLHEMAPTRREQQRVAKALAGAKRTLASYLQQRKESVVA